MLKHTKTACSQPLLFVSAAGLALFGALAVGQALQSAGVAASGSVARLQNIPWVTCGAAAPKHNLSQTTLPQLQALARFEQFCGGAVMERSSFFVPTPATVERATAYAADVAAILRQYARAGVRPVVFMEPITADGQKLDLDAYATGQYRNALQTYFAAIAAQGVTDAAMGTWVFVPEGNLPVWTSVDSNTYARVVTVTAQVHRLYFPSAERSIMLDSKTYTSAASWKGGAYTSLVPYVSKIPHGLLSSIGLQGFPWAAPAHSGQDNLYDPAVYLRTDLLAEAAQALGVQKVWFNTGTFHAMYADNPSQKVTLKPVERQAMLNSVLTFAHILQAQGFSVSIHLFAENKAATAEGTNWSYWNNGISGQDAAVLKQFIYSAQRASIPLWLFDSK